MVCRECKGKHHSLLHYIETPENTLKNANPNANDSLPSTSVNFNSNHISVLLSTAIVYVKDKVNKFHECRALLDVGSQSHFISEKMSNILGLQTEKTQLVVEGTNQSTNRV